MATATVICTCKICGETFRKSTTKHNRTEADNWEAWAKENFDTCPDCYRAKKAAETVEAAAKLRSMIDFPQLTGTEKQIDYANKLIDSYLIDNARAVKDYAFNRNGFDNLTAEDAAKLVERENMSIEEIKEKTFSQPYFAVIVKMMKISSAGIVIDLLKNY